MQFHPSSKLISPKIGYLVEFTPLYGANVESFIQMRLRGGGRRRRIKSWENQR